MEKMEKSICDPFEKDTIWVKRWSGRCGLNQRGSHKLQSHESHTQNDQFSICLYPLELQCDIWNKQANTRTQTAEK